MPTVTASPSPTPTEIPAQQINADCATLLPLAALYDLDPNLALLGNPAPETDPALEAVAAGGVACKLVHTSSGVSIEFAVSAPGSVALANARAGAGDPFDIGVSGVTGYSFGNLVQGFSATYRYSAQSSDGDLGLLAAVIAIAASSIG